MILTTLKEQLTRKMMIPKQFLPDSSIWQLRGRFFVIINISLFGAEKYSFTYDDFKVHAMILTISKNWKKKKNVEKYVEIFPNSKRSYKFWHDVKGKVHWKYLPTYLINLWKCLCRKVLLSLCLPVSRIEGLFYNRVIDCPMSIIWTFG